MSQDASPHDSTIQPVVTIVPLRGQSSDFAYWQSRPFDERLAALEDVRSTYAVRDRIAGYVTLSPDYKDFIQCLNDQHVRYLVVGGYAVALHGYPRFTKDMDLWIDRSPRNATRMVKALHQFGFASLGLKESDFLTPNQIIQLGYPPNRVDLITSLEGVEFKTCYPRRIKVSLEGVEISFIDLDNLRLNKKASGRPQDLADLDNLR